MSTMRVTLSEDLADFVTEQMRDGGYADQSQVICAGLRLLRERTPKRAALLAALEKGYAEAVAGKARPLTDKVLRDIARRGRELAERRARVKR